MENIVKIIKSPTFLKFVICLLMLLIGIIGLNAQTQPVRGIIVDETDQPVIGATIVERTTRAVAISDLNGAFVINLKPEATALEISYLGYSKKTIRLRQGEWGKLIKVELEPSELTLDEVVVIGYGTAKRGDVTGAVANVQAEDLEDRPNDNVLGTVQGELAGVEINNVTGLPGGELEVHIRGSASLSAEDSPLYVVDGVPLGDNEGLDGINPGDIESINVLKDASSSAIYGSRGANGVIIVTTKQAKSNERVSTSLNVSFSLQQIENPLDFMSPEEWIEWRMAYNNRNYMKQYGAYGAKESDDYQTRIAMIGGFDNKLVNDPRWTQPNYGGLALINWQDEVFRIAPRQSYGLSISGGAKRFGFRASVGYSKQEGIAIHSSYESLTGRVSGNAQVNDRVTVNVNLSMSEQTSHGGNSNVISMVPVAEPDAGVYTGSDPYPAYRWAGSSVSPVAIMEQTQQIYSKLRLSMNATIGIKIMDGLKAEMTGSYSLNTKHQRYFTPSTISSNWAAGEGVAAEGRRMDSHSNSYMAQGLLKYDKKFNRHTVNAVLGGSVESGSGASMEIRATNYPDNKVTYIDGVSIETLTRANAAESIDTHMLSAFFRMGYNYDNRYYFNGSIRGDGSSRFGANNRWAFFPALSAAWKISQEWWWPQIEWWNSAKLRVSWGINGNNRIREGAAMGTMKQSNYPFSGSNSTGYIPSSPELPNLTWEKTASWNWGIDMGFLNNRIQTTVEYYRKLTKDMLYQVTVPSVTGYTSIWDNVGEILNEGVELELRTKNIQTKDFKWSTSFNIAFVRNELVSMGGNNKEIITSELALIEGEPLNSFYMYDAVGVYQYASDLKKYPTMTTSQLGDVRYRDVNDDGVINEQDRTLVGKPNADFTLGFNNSFKYKGWELDVKCNGQFGGYLYSKDPGRFIDHAGMGVNLNTFRWWKDMWISEEQPGDGRTPSIDATTGDTRDTRWLFKRDFFRIKNVKLGKNFSFPKAFIRGMYVYASVENVWIWHKYPAGYSPENKGRNTYPMCRTYSLGMNFKF